MSDSGQGGDGGGVVRLVAIREDPLDVNEVVAALDDPASGALDLFIGRVRDHDGASAALPDPTARRAQPVPSVRGLGYVAHPRAEQELRAVAAEVAAEFDLQGVAVVHRVGELAVGDLAVVLGTASAHRGTAFDASRALIDRLKQRVPIWKRQDYSDGSDTWVGTP